LEGELIWFQEFLKDVRGLASGKVLLITGEAGTGKTHLLCDIAKERIHEGKPTILLMVIGLQAQRNLGHRHFNT